ncbi:MAG: hypothetical protein BMS9Abin37_2938 [Acidobacteriota bacterium]|nr:MAG: hypothetical protein BMS9Abin37_2938 [Acidobacteriota bacterium]
MSILQDEDLLRWGFLEENGDACAVVSDRMELVYLNEPARALVPEEWFGRRCFEILPTANDLCAFNCPTVAAVHDAHEILYCEEVLKAADGSTRKLGVAVIPLLGMSGDKARAVLLMRPQEDDGEEKLLSTARTFRADLLTRFQHH